MLFARKGAEAGTNPKWCLKKSPCGSDVGQQKIAQWISPQKVRKSTEFQTKSGTLWLRR